MQYDITAGNLFPSHSCIGVTQVKPQLGFEPGSPAWEADDLPTEPSLPPWGMVNSNQNVWGSGNKEPNFFLNMGVEIF